jgi:hypothetical protein
MSRAQSLSEARLIWLQRGILRRLGAMAARIRVDGTVEARAELAAWGVPWDPGVNDPRWTPAKRAACARSFKRLEQRGLVLRRNRRAPVRRRTTHILLLPRGEAVVQRLTRGPGNSP